MVDSERSQRFVSDGSDFTISPKNINCLRCKHKTPGKGTCKAFPDRIPKEILRGEVDHTSSYPGDHGIQFEAKEER